MFFCLQSSRVFLLNLDFFFQKSLSPCRKKKIKKKKKTIKKVAKLLTYGGQVIDPTACIYICIYIYGRGLFFCLPLGGGGKPFLPSSRNLKMEKGRKRTRPKSVVLLKMPQNAGFPRD